jgi:6-phosphogluconolactonase
VADGQAPPEHDAGADTGEAGDSAAMMPDGTAPPPGTDGGDATTSLGPLVAYASGYGPDIDVYAVDATSGALSLTSSVTAFGTSPSFLAIDRAVAHLYAVDENTTGRVGAYAIDPTTGALTFLDAVSSGGAGPPFVTLDRSEAFVLVANYGDGTVSVLPIQAGGTLGAAKSTLTVGTNAHMIITDLSNKFAFVPCLGSDYVAQFLFDATTGALTPNAVPHVMTATGAGPRHLAFHPDGKLAYLINETNSTLTAYSLDSTAGTLTEIQTVSTIQSGFTGTNTAAEVWVHPSGAWVLGSNRGDDSLVVFAIDQATGKMTPAGSTKSGGTTPRDFTIDPTGTLVYAANEGTGNVVPFAFDVTHGTLTPTAAAVSVTMASFVGVVRLP